MLSKLVHEHMLEKGLDGSRPSTGSGKSGGPRTSAFFTDLHGNADMDPDEYSNALFRDTSSQSAANSAGSRTNTPPIKARKNHQGNQNSSGAMNISMTDLLELAKTFTLDPKDRLAGGIAHFSKAETGKYFGVEAKTKFGKHTKKIYNQRNITHSSQAARMPVDVMQAMELCSPEKDSSLRKAILDTPFSADRPPLPYKMSTKVVIRTQSLGMDNMYSEMKLIQKPVELQTFDHILQEDIEKEKQQKEKDSALKQQILEASNAVAAMLFSPPRSPRLEPLVIQECTPDVGRKKQSTKNPTSNPKPSKQLPPLQAALLKNHGGPLSLKGDEAPRPTSNNSHNQNQNHHSSQSNSRQDSKKKISSDSSRNTSHVSSPREEDSSKSPLRTSVHTKRQSLRRMSSIFGGLTMTGPNNENADVSLLQLGEMYKVHKHGANDDDEEEPTAKDKKKTRRASLVLANDAEKSNYSGKNAMSKMPANSPMLELVCVDYRDPNNQKIIDRLHKDNSLFQYVEQKTLHRAFYDEGDESDNSDVEDEIFLLRQQREKILATNPTRLATAAVTKQRQKQQQKLQKMSSASKSSHSGSMAPIRVNKMKFQSQQRQELRANSKVISASRVVTPAIAVESGVTQNKADNQTISSSRNTYVDAFADETNSDSNKVGNDENNDDAVQIIRMWNDGDERHHEIIPSSAKDIDNVQPLSPRSMFIDNCLRANINPRATLILRKIYTRELNLKHLGMGNAVACLLAEAIVHIPYIESLNVCDNNLTDPGLSAIVNAIVHMQQLTVLDMSFNEIGPEAAKSMNNYLSNAQCPLIRLILEKADVDDDECRDFVQALHHNVNLRELTLNDNKVGSSENLNTVMPDIVTGGEAIAELLRSDKCPLQTLRLGWNMIRLGGAAELCQSLSMNQSLTFLELSYNALGVNGGIALGDALQDNKVLKQLLLANNSLDSVATLVICAGILENSNLEYVCFDENPIGQQGAMVLMLLPTIVGSRVLVSARNCNLSIRDTNNWFDTTAIVRTYDLDLSNPFDRSVGILISYLVPSHQTYILAHGEYFDPEKKEWIDLQLKELVDRESYKLKPMDPEQLKLIEGLVNIREATRDIQKAIALFEDVDADGSGQLDEDEFGSLLTMMGMDNSREKVVEIMSEYDVDGGGVIEMTEFLLFLKSQQKKASKRLKELTEISVLASILDNPLYQAPTGTSPPPSAGKLLGHRPAVMGATSSTQPVAAGANNPAGGRKNSLMMTLMKKHMIENPVKRFLPPRTGRLRMTVVDGFTQKETFRVISPCDRTNILKIAEQSGEMVQMTTFGMKNYRVRLSEALSIVYRLLKENSNKVKVLATVLPQMATPADAKALVFEVLGYNQVDVARLKREIGQAYRVIMGQPDGFFNLDLSNEMDRFCVNRLLEISMTTAHFRSSKRTIFGYGRLGDTSQHGNFSCFRNEMFNKKPVILCTEFASPLPKHGKLEFDFCSQKRYKSDNFALSDVRFTNLLVKTFQLDSSERLKALEALNRTRIACDKTLKGDGRTIYETPIERALEMGQFSAVFMEKLHERTEQIDRNRQKESVKVNWEHDPTALQLRLSTLHTIYKIPSLFKKSSVGGHNGIDVPKSSKSAAMAIGSAMMMRKSVAMAKRASVADVSASNASAGILSNTSSAAAVINSTTTSAGIISATGDKKPKMSLTFEASFEASVGDASSLSDPGTSASAGNSKPNRSRSIRTVPDLAVDDNNSVASNTSADMSDPVTPTILKMKRSSKSSSANSAGFRDMNDDAYSLITEHEEDEEQASLNSFGAESDRLMELINASVKEKEAATNPATAAVLVRASTVRRLNDVIQPKRKNKRGKKNKTQQRRTKIIINENGQEEEVTDVSDADNDEDWNDDDDDDDDNEEERAKAEEERQREEERRQRLEKPLTELWNRYVCLMGSTNVPPHAKAIRTLELLLEAFESQFFYARHLEMLLILFEEYGTLKHSEDFGTYRVELVVQLFSCVIDLHNWEIVMRRLTSFEAACVVCRLGILNIFNPMKPEGSYGLDMTQRDQRTVVKILAQLACVEPGDNLPFIQFRWERFMDPMPGFELTENWMTEEGMPRKGVLDCTYYAGEGKCKNGCKPHVKFRKALLQLTLLEEEEVVSEVDRDNEKEVTLVGPAYIQSSSSNLWLGYLAYNEAYAGQTGGNKRNGTAGGDNSNKKKK